MNKKQNDGLYLRGKTYWMDFTVNGIPQKRSCRTGALKLAQIILEKTKTDVVEGYFLSKDQARKHTFDQLMDKYVDDHSKVNHTAKTQVNVGIYRRHLETVFGGLTLDNITPQLVGQYKTQRLKAGMAPQTVVHELNCLGHAFKLATGEWGWTQTNPVASVQKPSVKNKIIRWLSDEEEQALMAAAVGYLNGQMPDIITVALHTGVRMGELLRLKWKNIDLFRRVVSVMQGKTGVQKSIPMSETLYGVLMARSKVVSMSGLVFRTGNDTGISAENLQREFWKVLEKAGVRNFRFHDLRHSFASRLVQAGKDLYSVSRLLGHTDARTSERYSHHNVDSLRDVIKALDKPEKKPKKKAGNE